MTDAQTFRFEHDDACGWRYVLRDTDDTPILMSTKYYPKLQEAVEDLQNLGSIVDLF